MMWIMDDGGVVDLYFHSPKEKMRLDPFLCVYHNIVALEFEHVAIQFNPIEL